MKHKMTAATLALLAAAFVWQAFAQTDCKAACKAKYDACLKQMEGPDDLVVQFGCQTLYNDCLKACK